MAATDDGDPRRNIEEWVAQTCGVIRRAAWGAKPPVHRLESDWNYDSIVIHYTGHGDYPDMRSVQIFDVEHRAWDDLSYHYAISPAGEIFEGRELIYKGSHIKLQNTGKIGIVCMGDFNSGWRSVVEGRGYSGDPVKSPMLGALKWISQTLISVFPIKVFGGHKKYGESETCPGTNLLPVVQAMRAEFKLATPVFRIF